MGLHSGLVRGGTRLVDRLDTKEVNCIVTGAGFCEFTSSRTGGLPVTGSAPLSLKI
jgi:hypothetical protein